MARLYCIRIVVALCALLVASCASNRPYLVRPLVVQPPEEPIAEDQLIDVSIEVLYSDELTAEQAKEEGTNSEIRKAECYFIAYHLKKTLEASLNWGAVHVVPSGVEATDLIVKGRIIHSNGEEMTLDVKAVDAAGRIWLNDEYEAEAIDEAFDNTMPEQKDVFQDLYNTVANDLAKKKNKISPEYINKLKTISRLKFAESFSPDAFDGYLKENASGCLKIERLPADDDPMMARLMKIRGRELMYLDILDGYYGQFYASMWAAYLNWRETNFIELYARREAKREALLTKVGGLFFMALPILAGGFAGLADPTFYRGWQAFTEADHYSDQAEAHSDTIHELNLSFIERMKPVVIEFQNKEYTLKGSAKQQYDRWRELLRKIYANETGFIADDQSHPSSIATNP